MSSPWPGSGFQPVSTPPPEPNRAGWLLGAGVLAILIVALVGVVVLLAQPLGAEPTPGPATPTPVAQLTPSPTPPLPTPPLPTPTPPHASPTPVGASPPPDGSPTPDPAATPTPPLAGQTLPPDIADQIDRVVAQVPAIRQLEPLLEVPYRLLTRAQLQSELEEMFEEEVDLEYLGVEERLLQRMALVAPDEDLHGLLLDLYGSAIAAYYRPDTGAFYVVERDEPFGPLDRVTVAHEYTHALQDQHFHLEGTRITDLAEGDAALAQLAVIEGDATQVMFMWAVQHLTVAEQLEMLASSLTQTDPDMLAEMPPILLRQLEFPYSDGFTFVSFIYERGGWEAVNEALRNPPVSTEQILHPHRYLAREQPVAVTLPDLTASFGAGWRHAYSQVFGELNVEVWAAGVQAGAPLPRGGVSSAQVAAGWGGDRLHMYESDAGAWAIVWETAWDSDMDAVEFLERAQQLLPTLDGASSVDRVPAPVAAEPDRVRLLIASDQQVLQQLAAALDQPLGYIDSGAEIPSRVSALASVVRTASTSARRAADVR